jgi:hydroxypyruvate reductase
MISDPRDLLCDLFDRAVDAVSAETCLPAALQDWPSEGRTLVIAVGKAAAAMAAVAAQHLPGSVSGLVVAPRGHHGPPHILPDGFETIEAGHPVPDAGSMAAAERALALALELGPDDRLLALISGGGSALLALPALELTLEDKAAVTRALLRSGAAIGEMNTVRKHLSRIKGGRLALAAAPARVTTLLISDIPGDDPAMIASGATVPDATSLAQARAILDEYVPDPPANVCAALADPANETPRISPGDVHIVARAADAFAAATRAAEGLGIEVTLLGDDLEGEARALGAEHAALALATARSDQPRLILSGGETTVRVVNRAGRGGRNVEYLLGLALALDGAPGVHAIACDTDGIDGTEDNAGAILAPDSLARARAMGLDPQALLDANRAYELFAALGDLVVTGPTRTNVNDFRAILIDPAAETLSDSRSADRGGQSSD